MLERDVIGDTGTKREVMDIGVQLWRKGCNREGMCIAGTEVIQKVKGDQLASRDDHDPGVTQLDLDLGGVVSSRCQKEGEYGCGTHRHGQVMGLKLQYGLTR